ncbi:MAG TPA: hypothetical protein VGW38_03530, partial [Chloroflexota bacterium]|nr:hypothetical protein [Chloroflexota bacterium]
AWSMVTPPSKNIGHMTHISALEGHERCPCFTHSSTEVDLAAKALGALDPSHAVVLVAAERVANLWPANGRLILAVMNHRLGQFGFRPAEDEQCKSVLC